MKPLKALLIGTGDWTGGAARAAYRLHTGLNRLAEDERIESTMLVASRQTHDSSVIQYRAPGGFANRVRRSVKKSLDARQLHRALHARPDGFEPFSTDRSPHGDRLLHALPPSDVVNLHWICGLIDLPTFLPALCARTPVVWTLHDMNPFTGGCHYDGGCGRFRSACGSCPQLGRSGPNDLSAKIWRRKAGVFDRLAPASFRVVAPSRWIAQQASGSSLLRRFEVSVIPYGLDTDAFSPRGMQLCRDALRIPRDKRVLLFVAQSSASPCKGFSLLMESIELLRNENIMLLSVGAGERKIEMGIPHLHLGSLEKDQLLALAYGAADLFVIPSRQDNFPNTVLESFACGTPVAGFAVGGIPEMVRPGETGVLAPPGDVPALASAIRNLLHDPALLRQMSINCRKVAVEEYDLTLAARRYAKLFAEMSPASTP